MGGTWDSEFTDSDVERWRREGPRLSLRREEEGTGEKDTVEKQRKGP